MSTFAPYFVSVPHAANAPNSSTAPNSSAAPNSLPLLGWRPFFSTQLGLDELGGALPGRVIEVHRSGPTVLTEKGRAHIATTGETASLLPEGGLAVGDWVLLDAASARLLRVLERDSLLARLAAGKPEKLQPIAANVDTLFVVTSCNHDFNPSRLERYLALAAQARVLPVLVLTKTDLVNDGGEDYVHRARSAAPHAEILALDATRRDDVVRTLAPWLDAGQTIAFVGSSGVGKSTLVNALLGMKIQATREIRADDSRGRHATTVRRMLPLPNGAWLIDTPGMRELKIGAAEEGVAAVFDDIAALAHRCRYRDCRHAGEQGCAVAAALAANMLDARRYASYVKLANEASRAAEMPWQRHERVRKLARTYKAVQRRRREERGERGE
jgi:ribosome biogenesis GTPase